MRKSILLWFVAIAMTSTGMIQTAWGLSFSGYLDQKLGPKEKIHSFSLANDTGLRFTVVWDSGLAPVWFEIWNEDDSLKYANRRFAGYKSGDVFEDDVALEKGAYKLIITNNWSEGGKGNYTISAEEITPKFQNDMEPNDELEDSQEVSLPGVIEGHLGYMDNEKK